LQVVNSAFLRALEALSVLLKKVFLITMPALPPKKSLAYIIGIMNMILHGVEAPNIIHTNTLAENLADIQEKDQCLYQEPCRANCTIINAIAYFRRDYLYNGFNQWTRSVVYVDHNAMTGDDLVDFVNSKLFPYLKKFKGSAENANTIEYKIGEIFSELKNRIQGGYNLREVLNLINELRFRTHQEKHEMSHLYEGKIKNMGNAGRNGGEYYTPRPLIKTIVKVISPKIGNSIYDGAVGSAGFLVEAFDYLNQPNLSTNDAF
jgi:type I restriction-modification system DNA methylase subunit